MNTERVWESEIKVENELSEPYSMENKKDKEDENTALCTVSS